MPGRQRPIGNRPVGRRSVGRRHSDRGRGGIGGRIGQYKRPGQRSDAHGGRTSGYTADSGQHTNTGESDGAVATGAAGVGHPHHAGALARHADRGQSDSYLGQQATSQFAGGSVSRRCGRRVDGAIGGDRPGSPSNSGFAAPATIRPDGKVARQAATSKIVTTRRTARGVLSTRKVTARTGSSRTNASPRMWFAATARLSADLRQRSLASNALRETNDDLFARVLDIAMSKVLSRAAAVRECRPGRSVSRDECQRDRWKGRGGFGGPSDGSVWQHGDCPRLTPRKCRLSGPS